MKKYKWWEEDAPVNATGPAVVGTGDDSSTVVVRKKTKVYRRKKRMTKKEVEEARNYRKEYDEYHAKPEQRERNAARLRARRQMEKWGKVKKFDKMDVHHKDNNPLNNEKDNLAVTTQNWNRSEPRLRKEELDEAVSAKEFDSLKKGDTVTIEYKSAMSTGKSTFKVTAKNVVGKARVEKVTLQSIKNPRGVKHFLYKRSTGVTFAQGDMGSQVVSFKKEEIEEALYYELPSGKKLDISKLSLSNRRKLTGKKGMFKVVDGKLIPRLNTKAYRKKAMDDFAKYAGQAYEEIEEIINIQERELTPKELKRREEIAQDLSDADFKKQYGDRWKEVKMGVATNMAKKESINEQDPKADAIKAKELKIAKAIAAAQLAIAKEQERVQKLTDLQKKVKDQATEETTMSKKYLKSKDGTLEEAVINVWQDAAEEVGKLNVKQEGFSSSLVKKAVKIAADMGGDMTGAVKKIEKIKRGLSDDPAVSDALRSANEQKEESSKVDGRTRGYKEALRRIKVRQERNRVKLNPVAEEALEEKLKKGFFMTPNGDAVWVQNDPSVLPKAWAKKVEAGKIDPTKMDFSGPPNKWKEIKASYDPELEEASGDKEAYKKFFDAALKKFDAKSPADMDDEKKKKFFDYIDKNWEGKDEKKEALEFSEKIEYVEYKFKNKAHALAAKKFFDGQQRMEFAVNDDGVSQGLLSVDAGKNDMTKYHEAIVKKLKPEILSTEEKKN